MVLIPPEVVALGASLAARTDQTVSPTDINNPIATRIKKLDVKNKKLPAIFAAWCVL